MKRVYVCTPLAAGKFDLELISITLLARNVFAFIPPRGQLNHKTIGAKLDRKMIDACDEVYVFGPIGRDCAWEIGYATGLGKPVTIFQNESNAGMLREDWMTIIDVKIDYLLANKKL